MPRSKAIVHEATEGHVRNVREHDGEGPITDLLAASDEIPSHEEPLLHSPLLPSSPGCFEFIFSPDNKGTASLDDSQLSEGPELLFAVPATVHGPALPSDPPSQIYDDYGGNLAAYKPTLNNPAPGQSPGRDEDTDPYNVILECASSDEECEGDSDEESDNASSIFGNDLPAVDDHPRQFFRINAHLYFSVYLISASRERA
ncbi:hypothetical protein DENSPDRAFT_883338 [Dentipellis sp. KUC8613]|nr:hypothetical protein DENSPDRAFT_883338 [Dentipellis sp. KUC8613]